jgi:hypothetical protein
MSADELAEALMAARGSYTGEPKRTPQAIGLVRAAVEAELARGGDARLATYRFRGTDPRAGAAKSVAKGPAAKEPAASGAAAREAAAREAAAREATAREAAPREATPREATAPRVGTVLVGREPDDPTAVTTAADLLAYAVRLGRRAADLAGLDPLATRARAVEGLRAIAGPRAAPVIGDARLLQLAAAASNGAADLNAQGQLYPVGMSAPRALRLATNSLIGQRLTPEQVRARVRARFPRAEDLPAGRLDLDELLTTCEVPLEWDPAQQVYAPGTAGVAVSSTRRVSTVAPLARPGAADEADAKLAAALDRRAFLAVLAPLRRLAPARRALLTRLRLTEVNVTAIMIERLRALDFPWEAIAEADSGQPADPDFRSLVELVQHEVIPAVEAALAVAEPVLLTDAAPLARYGDLRLLQELADPTRPRPAARLLLVPARRPEPAMLDQAQLPLTSPASQSLWLPDTWITPTVERAAS